MHLIAALMKRTYWPLCRAYARYLGDRPADGLLTLFSRIQFRFYYGFWPNFAHPKRFSEKIWSRQLYDRDPKLTLISDKVAVRAYVADIIGSEYLIPMHWTGTRPEDIPFDTLPDRFVIKANHGCAYNIIVPEKRLLDRESARNQLKQWLAENFGAGWGLGIAWAYKNIRPQILVEEMLVEDGHVPIDYKFFCFSGRMEFFKMDFERFEGHATRFFDRERTPLDFVEVGLKTYQKQINFPPNLDKMVRVAEDLAKGFEFIRVDLYSVGSRIFFSELTVYPGGISAPFDKDEYDYKFGEKWVSAPRAS